MPGKAKSSALHRHDFETSGLIPFKPKQAAEKKGEVEYGLRKEKRKGENGGTHRLPP